MRWAMGDERLGDEAMRRRRGAIRAEERGPEPGKASESGAAEGKEMKS